MKTLRQEILGVRLLITALKDFLNVRRSLQNICSTEIFKQQNASISNKASKYFVHALKLIVQENLRKQIMNAQEQALHK